MPSARRLPRIFVKRTTCAVREKYKILVVVFRNSIRIVLCAVGPALEADGEHRRRRQERLRRRRRRCEQPERGPFTDRRGRSAGYRRHPISFKPTAAWLASSRQRQPYYIITVLCTTCSRPCSRRADGTFRLYVKNLRPEPVLPHSVRLFGTNNLSGQTA